GGGGGGRGSGGGGKGGAGAPSAPLAAAKVQNRGGVVAAGSKRVPPAPPATPARFMSSASAARGERSRMRPRVYGPRSLILTTIERPLSRFVTFANEAIGSERCAAVAVTVSRISPLAVCLPTRLYQAAFPNCLVPAGRPGLQQESRTLHRFARGSRLARRGAEHSEL